MGSRIWVFDDNFFFILKKQERHDARCPPCHLPSASDLDTARPTRWPPLRHCSPPIDHPRLRRSLSIASPPLQPLIQTPLQHCSLPISHLWLRRPAASPHYCPPPLTFFYVGDAPPSSTSPISNSVGRHRAPPPLGRLSSRQVVPHAQGSSGDDPSHSRVSVNILWIKDSTRAVWGLHPQPNHGWHDAHAGMGTEFNGLSAKNYMLRSDPPGTTTWMHPHAGPLLVVFYTNWPLPPIR
jgi:hypothetical protein